MRRIVIWFASTVTILVLLFGYHTSTNHTSSATATGTSTSSSTGSSSTTSGSSGSSGASGSASSAPPPDDSDSSRSSGSGSSDSGSGSSSSSTSYTGDVAQTEWGPVQVKITVSGGKITAVDVVEYPTENPKDQQINSYALPILVQETTDQQSADIDAVSGATVTSDGYIQSLQSAIDKAGI